MSLWNMTVLIDLFTKYYWKPEVWNYAQPILKKIFHNSLKLDDKKYKETQAALFLILHELKTGSRWI